MLHIHLGNQIIPVGQPWMAHDKLHTANILGHETALKANGLF